MIEQRLSQLITTQKTEAILKQHDQAVIGNYARFPLLIEKGKGSYVWDSDGRRYLDFAQGIAVNALGHCHDALVHAIKKQAEQLIHVSNLFYHEMQARLAQRLINTMSGRGRVFFCNSGAEANEALIKISRRYGHTDRRYHIITALSSFHGRTMATLSATGQDKVKIGFDPLLPDFTHVPFNDIDAIKTAYKQETVAILIEGIQGEGGVNVAHPEYLLAIKKFCQERDLLLLWDGVQCGMYRTGCFQSYERILEGINIDFIPDAIAMAKSLGGGFPIGAIWVRDPLHQLMTPGSHGTTYGGNPMACAASLAVFDVIEKENLKTNIRQCGELLKTEIQKWIRHDSSILSDIRGYGGLLGIELCQPHARSCVQKLIANGLLTAAAGDRVIRLLPPLNVTATECEEALHILRKVLFN